MLKERQIDFSFDKFVEVFDLENKILEVNPANHIKEFKCRRFITLISKSVFKENLDVMNSHIS